MEGKSRRYHGAVVKLVIVERFGKQIYIFIDLRSIEGEIQSIR
jgi:hypothetical protein